MGMNYGVKGVLGPLFRNSAGLTLFVEIRMTPIKPVRSFPIHEVLLLIKTEHEFLVCLMSSL